MTQTVRLFAFALLGTAAIIFITYMIPPLRAIWPYFKTLPGAIQFGLGAAFFGIVLLIISLLMERVAEREYNESLRDD
jgi:hypothetical protein